MKVTNAVGSVLGMLALFTLSAGVAGNDFTDGPRQTPASGCMNLANDPVDYEVVHAIWQRPGWVAPGHAPRNKKIWI